MRILIISPTQSGIGGIAQHISGLSCYLQQNRNSVDIISSENTFTIPIKGLKNPSFMISSFLKSKFMKDYDIVHAHNIPSAYAMKNVSGKKILTLHGVYSKQIDLLHGKTSGNVTSYIEKNALKWADAITVISKEAYNFYKKLGFDVHHIPNAIDITKIPNEGKKLVPKQIIFVGRLSKEKGIIQLLNTVKNLPDDVTLLILGSGPLKDLVLKAEQKFKNLQYLGYKPKEETLKLIKGSDLLIQPSLVEGISSTLLESMACKTPIIASNVLGNQELITHNENGILVDPNNTELIVHNILDLLANKEKCSKFVQNSSNLILNYTWEKVGKSYYELYQSLLD